MKPENQISHQYLEDLKQLRAQLEEIEERLSNKNEEFHIQRQRVTLENVQKAIPNDAALVEFASYQPFDAKTSKLGERRYVVYTLTCDGIINWTDLGLAEPIDTLALELGQMLRKELPWGYGNNQEIPEFEKTSRIIDLTQELSQKVVSPVLKLIPKKKHLLISPDGGLNLIPFAALMDNQNQYLIQSFTLTYLSSGRDLIRLPSGSITKQPILILPTNEAIQIEDEDLVNDDQRFIRVLFNQSPSSMTESHTRNQVFSTKILSVQNYAKLDLWKTQLVVLHNFEPILLRFRNWEEIYKLRRALVLAGSESQLMSLWQVSDKGAEELRVRYFKRLARGEGRSEALRQVQLEMLKEEKWKHPFFWAAFIQSGEWANLDGKR